MRVYHCGISSVIFGLGRATKIPNIMLCDSGSKQAILSAYIGSFASDLFMVTGFGGMCASILFPSYVRLIYPLFCIGIGVQWLAFVNPFYEK